MACWVEGDLHPAAMPLPQQPSPAPPFPHAPLGPPSPEQSLCSGTSASPGRVQPLSPKTHSRTGSAKELPCDCPGFSQSGSVHFELPAPSHSLAGTSAPCTLSYRTQRILGHCPASPASSPPVRMFALSVPGLRRARPSLARCATPDTAAHGPGGTLAPPPPLHGPVLAADAPGRPLQPQTRVGAPPVVPGAQIPVLAPGNPPPGGSWPPRTDGAPRFAPATAARPAAVQPDPPAPARPRRPASTPPPLCPLSAPGGARSAAKACPLAPAVPPPARPARP